MRKFQVLVTFESGYDGRSVDLLTLELAEQILRGDVEPPGTLKLTEVRVVKELETE